MYNLTSIYNLDVPHTRISGLRIVRILLEIHAEAIPAFKLGHLYSSKIMKRKIRVRETLLC